MSFSLATALSLVLATATSAVGSHIAPSERSVTAADWDFLNTTVNGRLHLGVPLAQPCYDSYENGSGTFDVGDYEACPAVQAGYLDEHLHTDRFGGYVNTNWGECQIFGQQCNLNGSDLTQSIDASAICYQGSVPDYHIDVANVSDIQAGIRFAKEFDLPLVVKNTGHDYKGRSSGPGSLALWTHNLQPDTLLSQNFTPSGCDAGAGKAVTYGAGQQWEGLYEFGEANNVFLVGGSDLTVGAAGGWLLGGGHGFLSPMFGLGTDNVLQIKAVLPNGTYITANRCQNEDIFFALRGGGGSAFGVVVEVTSRAWDAREVQAVNVLFAAASIDAYNAFLDLATQNANKWASEGWGGGIFAGSGGRTVIEFQAYNMNLSLEDSQASMQPVFDFLQSPNNSASTLSAEIKSFPTIWQAYQAFLAPLSESVGIGTSLASRLIPSSLLAAPEGQQQVSALLAQLSNDLIFPTSSTQRDPLSVNYSAPIQILMTTPYAYTPTSLGESFTDSAVTPAWRNSTWHVIAVQSFASQADPATIDAAFKAAHAAGEKLRALAPDSGAYQNEAEIFEPDPVAAFWGQANFDRLSAIKQEIDQDNILTCWDCIGSDRNDSRYRCYPSS